jgi:hypothetical protein
MALPPQINWGSHVPDVSASPHIRLSCVLLDLLASNTIQTATHAPSPYFDTTAAKVCFLTRYDNTSGLDKLISAYGLDRIPEASTIGSITFRILTKMQRTTDPSYGPMKKYIISAEALTGDVNREPFSTVTEHGITCPLDTSIVFEWFTPDGPEDVVTSTGWDCVVGIIAHESWLCSRQDGSFVFKAEHDFKMMQNLDPLRHLGYLGWPGILPVVEGGLQPTFRRM